LCELENCSQNAAVTHEYVVFRSELDFQAHKRKKHAKTKNDLKAFSRINIEFNTVQNSGSSGSGGGGGGGSNRNNNYNRNRGGPNQQRNRNNYDNDDSNEDDYNNQRRRTQPQSKIQTTDIDPHVLRQSKEQYEREEADRKRLKNIERLKEQYKEYTTQNGNSSSAAASSVLNPAAEDESTLGATAIAPIAPKIEEEPSIAQLTNTTWRDLLGSGAAPVINRDEEFPSLATIGAAIGSSSSIIAQTSAKKSTAWSKNTPPTNNNINPTLSSSSKASSTSKKPAEAPILPLKQTQLDKVATFKLGGDSDDDSDSEFQLHNSKKSNKKNKNKKNAIKVNEPPTQIKSSSGPPPGFDSVKPDSSSKLKPSTAPPPGFSPIPSENHTQKEFIKPDNFDERNSELKSKLFLLFGHFNEAEFENFKELSIDFRASNLDASEYLIKSQKLLEPENVAKCSKKSQQESKILKLKFFDLVQEMLVLLPDQTKQQELYNAYIKLVESEGASSNQSSVWGDAIGGNKSNRLMKCQFCEQFFLNTEFNFHQSSHHAKELGATPTQSSQIRPNKSSVSVAQEDFPSLTSVSKNPLQTQLTSSRNNSNMSLANLISSPHLAKEETVHLKKQPVVVNLEDEFPALSTVVVPPSEMRYSAMPTPSIFSNPSSHLSILNKKKHRLQK
jgi:hypothetical protein